MRDDYKYTYISSATTTQVNAGRTRLIRVVVNTTAAGAISIIDNTSGSTVNVASLKASIAEGTYYYGITLTTGLRVITAGASDVTVVWTPA
jgi:hypothetical protein